MLFVFKILAAPGDENVYEPLLVLTPAMIADSEKDASMPSVFVTCGIT